MSPLQQAPYEVYQYIAAYIEQHQYSPIPSDIAQALQIEIEDVEQIICDLRERGYITHLSHSSRMMYLTAVKPSPPQAKPKRRTTPLNPPENSMQRKQIHQFIADFVAEHQYPPSHRDIAAGLDIASTSTVKYHLNVLRDQGYLTFVPGRSRSLALTERPFILDASEQQPERA